MHLPTINHGVGWELLETRDGALVCLGLGFSEGHTAWLSRSIIVSKAWSMASPSFSFGIGSEMEKGMQELWGISPEHRVYFLPLRPEHDI